MPQKTDSLKINRPNIQIIGNDTQAGTYILRIRLAESQKAREK